MTFLVLLVLSLAMLGRVQSGMGAARQKTALARQNAYFALELALAHLEETAGPDQRATAIADITDTAKAGAAHWTGAWDYRTSHFPSGRWLVSGETSPDAFQAPANPNTLEGGGAIWLVWKNTVADPGDYVAVPLVDLTAPGSTGEVESTGRYAYWIGDEGVKASVLAVDRVDRAAPEFAAQQLRQRANPAHQVESLLPGWQSRGAEMLADLDRLLDPYQLPALLPGPVAAAWRAHYHDLTVCATGLLTNADPETGGGLRLNLQNGAGGVGRGRFDDPFASGAALRAWHAFPERDARGRLPLAPISAEAFDALEIGEPYVSVVPVLGEALLRLAVFHHWQRDEPAIRYTIEAEFLNPFTAPLLLSADDRRALTVNVTGLPLITMANLSTGALVGPLPIDQMPGSGGGLEMSAYMEFSRGSGDDPSGNAVLLPGETYRRTAPDGAAQPEGLVKYTGRAFAVEKDHEILVSLKPPEESLGTDFSIHRGMGNGGAPIWEARNIPYEASLHRFEAPLDGGLKPFVIDSTDVKVESMFVFGFHFALGFGHWTDADNLGSWRDAFDLRRPYLDYLGNWNPLEGNSRANREFINVVSPLSAEIEARANDVFRSSDWIFDDVPGKSTPGTHADLRLYDVPQGDPVSVADFRLLPFKGLPPRALGSPAGGVLNSAFDRYFLSTVPADWIPDEDGVPMNAVFPNSRLRLVSEAFDVNGHELPPPTVEDLQGKYAARYFRIRGAFNWNSTSVHAWRAVLTHAFTAEHAWLSIEADGSLKATPIERAVFRHPFGAPAGGRPLADAAFRNGSLSAEALRAVYFCQGVRSVGEADIANLARAIVGKLRERGRPFPSLAAFMNAGVLADALKISGFNSGFPRHANGHVSQSDIVALLSLGAAVRSDTFVIRTYGDVWNPRTGRVEGRAALEARVRRTLEYVEPGLSPTARSPGPRRFEIVAFRWLDPESEF